MSTSLINRVGKLALALIAACSLCVGPGQTTQARTTSQDSAAAPNVQHLEQGKKYKIKGVVISRSGDGFILKDAKLVETMVLLTGTVKVQIDGKPVTEAQKTELRKLVGGIIVEVQGKGDANGYLACEKASISSKDMRAAMATANKIAPVESRMTAAEEQIKKTQEQQKQLSGQVDELTVLSSMAMEEAKKANDRVSALDDYTTLDTVTVTFAVNSAVLNAQAKQALDTLAAKTENLKAYAFEITGYTDTTGNAAKNLALSDKRANAVTRYLTDMHKIPLRRIVTPLGYGAAKPAAANTTAEGRMANRRVEVKLMQQGGITQ